MMAWIFEKRCKQMLLLVMELHLPVYYKCIDILGKALPSVKQIQIIGNSTESHIAVNHLLSRKDKVVVPEQFFAFF